MGKKWPIGTAFCRADQCSEKPLKNVRLPVPDPVTLLLYWGAASCLHYPPKFKMLLCSFPTRGKVHTLRLCLISWPVPWRTSSFQQKFPNPKSKPAYVPPPRAQKTKRVPTLLQQSALTPGQGCFSGRICLLGCAASGQHHLRDEIPTSETNP